MIIVCFLARSSFQTNQTIKSSITQDVLSQDAPIINGCFWFPLGDYMLPTTLKTGTWKIWLILETHPNLHPCQDLDAPPLFFQATLRSLFNRGEIP